LPLACPERQPSPRKSHSKCSASAPEAKVVLSVRDGRAWARSMHDTIWGVLYDEQSIVHHLAVAQGRIDQAMSAYTELMADMINRADLFGSTPTRFDEDGGRMGTGAMEKLTGWWSRQPDPSRPGPASAIAWERPR
jgi:Sulfotransferase domain